MDEAWKIEKEKCADFKALLERAVTVFFDLNALTGYSDRAIFIYVNVFLRFEFLLGNSSWNNKGWDFSPLSVVCFVASVI